MSTDWTAILTKEVDSAVAVLPMMGVMVESAGKLAVELAQRGELEFSRTPPRVIQGGLTFDPTGVFVGSGSKVKLKHVRHLDVEPCVLVLADESVLIVRLGDDDNQSFGYEVVRTSEFEQAAEFQLSMLFGSLPAVEWRGRSSASPGETARWIFRLPASSDTGTITKWAADVVSCLNRL